jgi:hypothetical protein
VIIVTNDFSSVGRRYPDIAIPPGFFFQFCIMWYTDVEWSSRKLVMTGVVHIGQISMQTTKECNTTESVVQVCDPQWAEQIKLLLLTFKIQACLIRRDPAAMSMLISDILVISTDHAKAKQLFKEENVLRTDQEWTCSMCFEQVPNSFDLCWNCGTLLPNLQQTPIAEDIASSRKVLTNAG